MHLQINVAPNDNSYAPSSDGATCFYPSSIKSVLYPSSESVTTGGRTTLFFIKSMQPECQPQARKCGFLSLARSFIGVKSRFHSIHNLYTLQRGLLRSTLFLSLSGRILFFYPTIESVPPYRQFALLYWAVNQPHFHLFSNLQPYRDKSPSRKNDNNDDRHRP